MITKGLHDNWSMRNSLDNKWINTTIPSSVYSDLLSNNLIENPYYRDNELEALKLMEYDYEYVTKFNVEEEILGCEEVFLTFEGIDTLAEITLNDIVLGKVNNMHRTWEYKVKKYLKKFDNKLMVKLFSPTKFIRQQYEKDPIEGSSDSMKGFPHIRKAHCMFGWDWGPRLPDAGIWRDVKLSGVNYGRLESVYITQEHYDNEVDLCFRIDVDLLNKKYSYRFYEDKELEELKYRYKVTITSPSEEVMVYDYCPKKIKIESPELWWPNGYGVQPLYHINVDLIKNEEIIDTFKCRIGLRTLTIERKDDEYGQSFAHKVNGVPIFAMGADYIPEDNILPLVNKERTYKLLKQCKLANYNTIRVWGGGNYPYDDFYNACDELGLIVWQDFMFACAVYDLTDDFEENIRAEFVDNIRRIRHHACLGLWCGNNEMELFMDMGLWTKDKKLKADYIKMFQYIIPSVLKEEDPQSFYWPSSPSSGGNFDDPSNESKGDVHYWDVWHGNKPITDYRNHCFRYVSEFGFQSFPCLKTVEAFTEEEDRNIFSYVMEKHQRNQSANGKIMNYMEQTFLYPNNFEVLLYASQLLQGEAVRYGVEHFRRNRGRCMGSIIWQLNDCWPVASWASIDYYGRWKALHYYEKRFFAPLMLSCDEEGILTQDSNPNAEPYNVKKSIHLCVANETFNDENVVVSWYHRNNKGDILKSKSYEVNAKALSSTWLEKVNMQELSLYDEYISYEMKKNNKVISSGTCIFCAPKHFKYIKPNIKLSVNGDKITVSSDVYAKSVEIYNENNDMILSDNFFDLNGDSVTVQILEGKPNYLKARSVYDIR